MIKILKLDGMTCPACELRLEDKLSALNGVLEVSAKYSNGTVKITFEPNQLKISEIVNAVECLDYSVISIIDKFDKFDKFAQSDKLDNSETSQSTKKSEITSVLGIIIIMFALYLLINNTIGFSFFPAISQNMGFFALFVVGLLTSLHCLSMCGGINLSQSINFQNSENSHKYAKFAPSLLYNAGRVISYTIIGGIVGAIGSVFAISGTASGFVAIVAGVFMVIMGINMLNIFPALRKIVPIMPKIIARKVNSQKANKTPFVVGLLNGFMPCGPLQTMQIYALGTGSAAVGALSMFFFSIGTVPLMFAFGAVSSLLSTKFTAKMLKVSAVLVMFLGVIMFNRGASLSGFDPLGNVINAVYAINPVQANAQNLAQIRGGVQYVESTVTANHYQPITVQVGVPVVWTIHAESLNGCNNPILINEFEMTIDMNLGENIVEFTPMQTGVIPYTCWMGMIRSRIIVVDDLGNLSEEETTLGDAEYEEFAWIVNFLEGFFAQDFIIDGIAIPVIEDDVQTVTITRQNGKITPNTIVLQDGIDFKIAIDILDELDPLAGNENELIFPEFGALMNLIEFQETNRMPALFDFAFGDILGNTVFVKIVGNVENFDISYVERAAADYFSG
ncbi:MAG: sulfite exporter TauE/SafE family protein [Firmicutes bacterium]|nr:sulfite exporter TauE/SafE family protein [Bacillota bacterium]